MATTKIGNVRLSIVYRERHSLRSCKALLPVEMWKKKRRNVVIQTVKVIPSSNLHPRWRDHGGGGIPQNESEAV